jgi:hypothetical protein
MHPSRLDWGLANPGPHRREPRIGAVAGAKGLPGSAFAPPEYPYTRSFSNRTPVLSSLSGHEVKDIASSVRPHGYVPRNLTLKRYAIKSFDVRANLEAD